MCISLICSPGSLFSRLLGPPASCGALFAPVCVRPATGTHVLPFVMKMRCPSSSEYCFLAQFYNLNNAMIVYYSPFSSLALSLLSLSFLSLFPLSSLSLLSLYIFQSFLSGRVMDHDHLGGRLAGNFCSGAGVRRGYWLLSSECAALNVTRINYWVAIILCSTDFSQEFYA